MIYTVTFNPALDYVVKVDHFTPGKVNRTVKEDIYYGGKGINVSAVLANLGYESTALGFVAGFTGEEIERGVKSLGFASDFIRVKEGMSRINVKLKSDQESEINGMGPKITGEDVEALFQKLEEDLLGLLLDGALFFQTPGCNGALLFQGGDVRRDGLPVRFGAVVLRFDPDAFLLRCRQFALRTG